MIYLLSFRDESRDTGGAVLPGRLRVRRPDGTLLDGRAALDALTVEGKIVFLLHGFNVSRDEGTDSLLRFADSLPLNNAAGGALVATIWPGDHWTGALSYSFEGEDADDTAFELARFIKDNISPAVPLSFATHSLGARVALGTMNRLVGTGFSVQQVCLMAPAIDDDSLSDVDVYRRAATQAARVGVLHSNEDGVLKWAYPAGDLLQSFFFWRDESGLALGYHGPRRADSSPGSIPSNLIEKAVGAWDVGHGDYLPSPNPNAQQTSAARYADDQLAGRFQPRYP